MNHLITVRIKKMSHVGFEPLAPGWKNDYKAGALTLYTIAPKYRISIIILKQVYKTIYSNTHPFAFVYSQRQKIRSMTAITTNKSHMPWPVPSDPGSRDPGPRF